MSYDNTLGPKKTLAKAPAAATTGGYRDYDDDDDYDGGFRADIDDDDDTDPRVSYASGAAAPAMTGAGGTPATAGGKLQKGQLDMLATAYSSDIVEITGTSPVGYKILAHGNYRLKQANPVETFKPRIGDYFIISKDGVWESLQKEVALKMVASLAESRHGVAVINNYPQTTSSAAAAATSGAAAAATKASAPAATKAAAPKATGAAAPKATGASRLVTACKHCGTAKMHTGSCAACELYDTKQSAPKVTGPPRLTTACKHCGTATMHGSRCAACDMYNSTKAAAPRATGNYRQKTEQDYVNQWAERQRSRFDDDE